MKAFAELCDNLAQTTRPDAQIRLLADYFSRTPDPDRGWAIALLAGTVALPVMKAPALRNIAADRLDPHEFVLCQEYMGDLAETMSLIWPDTGEPPQTTSIPDIISLLQHCSNNELPSRIAACLASMSISERYILLKIATRGLRIGMNGPLIRRALAVWGNKPAAEVDELWPALTPPYQNLFGWLSDKAPPPQIDRTRTYRAQMPAEPITAADLAELAPEDFVAEWKWDGVRALLVAYDGEPRLYARSSNDLGPQFPEILAAFRQIPANGVLDGELQVIRDGQIAPFSDLQKRLGRKSAPKSLQTNCPARLRVFDLLFDDREDLRPLPFTERRERLEDWYRRTQPSIVDVSPIVTFADWDSLAHRRSTDIPDGADGLMLKRRDSTYNADPAARGWLKWQREAFTAECVLMYAQHGLGERRSYYAEYTFGCWRDGPDGHPELVPVGKASPSLSDEKVAEIDTWIRGNATEKFGPVRAVTPGLVFQVAFDAVHPSARRKSGLSLRAPRIVRLRSDMPAAAADRLDHLLALMA